MQFIKILLILCFTLLYSKLVLAEDFTLTQSIKWTMGSEIETSSGKLRGVSVEGAYIDSRGHTGTITCIGSVGENFKADCHFKDEDGDIGYADALRKGVDGVSGSTVDSVGRLRIYELDSNGNEIWTKLFGTELSDIAWGGTFDENVYLWGETHGNLNGEVNNYLGNEDAYLIKLDSNGNEIWTTLIGTELNEEAWDISVGSDYSVYLVGETQDSNVSNTDDILISKIAVFAYAGFRILPSLNRTLTSINRLKSSIPIVQNITNEFPILFFGLSKFKLITDIHIVAHT